MGRLVCSIEFYWIVHSALLGIIVCCLTKDGESENYNTYVHLHDNTYMHGRLRHIASPLLIYEIALIFYEIDALKN